MTEITKYQGSDLLPTKEQWQIMRETATTLIKSGFLPQSVRTAEQAIAIIQRGREMNLPPMTAFSTLHVVNGRVGLSAELMRAMVYQRNLGEIEVTEHGSDKCAVRCRRAGSDNWQVFTYTMEDAKRAGLSGRDPWKKHPASMLLARVTSIACRAVFADVTLGLYTEDELENMPSPPPVPVVAHVDYIEPGPEPEPVPANADTSPEITEKQMKKLHALAKDLDCDHAWLKRFCAALKVDSMKDLSKEQAASLIDVLERLVSGEPVADLHQVYQDAYYAACDPVEAE